MKTLSPHISKDTFVEILQDKQLLRTDDLKIFQTIYSLDNQEASATDLARIIGWTDKGAVVGRIVGLGIRIIKKYDIQQREREDGSKVFWDFFFTGYDKGTFFIYKLKPELKEALEECGLINNAKPIAIQNTYLLFWNPKKWTWDTLEQDIEQVDLTGKCSQRWSCGNIKSIQAGDRIFLVKLGTEPKGLIAAGFATSTPFREKHWSVENKEALYINIDFEVLLNPEKEPILTVEMLRMRSVLQKQNWSPQSSTSLKPELVDELEAVWFEFLTTQNIRHNPFIPTYNKTQKTYSEGTVNQVSVTKYERNPFARKECLDYYGFSCSVCDFNFEKYYGSIGFKFIHVHHLTQVATIKQEYKVNPIKDLRPVCPNCHAMLHKQNPPLTIDELKQQIKNG